MPWRCQSCRPFSQARHDLAKTATVKLFYSFLQNKPAHTASPSAKGGAGRAEVDLVRPDLTMRFVGQEAGGRALVRHMLALSRPRVVMLCAFSGHRRFGDVGGCRWLERAPILS